MDEILNKNLKFIFELFIGYNIAKFLYTILNNTILNVVIAVILITLVEWLYYSIKFIRECEYNEELSRKYGVNVFSSKIRSEINEAYAMLSLIPIKVNDKYVWHVVCENLDDDKKDLLWHEVAHVKKNHSIKTYILDTIIEIIGVYILFESSIIKISVLLVIISTLVIMFIYRSYKLYFEIEADKYLVDKIGVENYKLIRSITNMEVKYKYTEIVYSLLLGYPTLYFIKKYVINEK